MNDWRPIVQTVFKCPVCLGVLASKADENEHRRAHTPRTVFPSRAALYRAAPPAVANEARHV